MKTLTKNQLINLESIYQAFASLPRLKMLIHLSEHSPNECEHSVNELALIAGLTQSATSHQLKWLRDKKIVKYRKEGLKSYYSLFDKHIITILESAINHLENRGEY